MKQWPALCVMLLVTPQQSFTTRWLVFDNKHSSRPNLSCSLGTHYNGYRLFAQPKSTVAEPSTFVQRVV